MEERIELKKFFIWLPGFLGSIAAFVLGTMVMTNDSTPKGITAVPLIIFFVLQRYFVRGIIAGSVKG